MRYMINGKKYYTEEIVSLKDKEYRKMVNFDGKGSTVYAELDLVDGKLVTVEDANIRRMLSENIYGSKRQAHIFN